jgi:hypothetical protein
MGQAIITASRRTSFFIGVTFNKVLATGSAEAKGQQIMARIKVAERTLRPTEFIFKRRLLADSCNGNGEPERDESADFQIGNQGQAT